jgi:hypothetical protein
LVHIFVHIVHGGRLVLLLFRLFRDHGLRGQHQARHRSGVLEGEADHLGGIDHTRGQEIFVGFALGVESVIILSRENPVQHRQIREALPYLSKNIEHDTELTIVFTLSTGP